LLALLTSCASPAAERVAAEKERCRHILAVPFGYRVNPQGELTHFEVYPAKNCRMETVELAISPAWKKTACAVFSTQSHAPTPEAELRFFAFVYDSDRPSVVFPRADAGISPENPVIEVEESILETDGSPKGVCDGDLDVATQP
jgi:hypothetical protein